MTKKILLLVLSLPLILMICLFTTSSTVSLAIPIPVERIEITSDKIVDLDLDDPSKSSFEVEYTIYPTNATNKNITFLTEAVENERFAEFEFDGNKVIAKSVGSAKVYISTSDGGFKDSFLVRVSSERVQEIKSTVEKNQVYVGEELEIKTSFFPESATDRTLKLESSNKDVLTTRVSSNGKYYVTAVGKGVATITVTSESNPEAKSSFEVEVFNKDQMDLSHTYIKTGTSTGSLNISVENDVDYTISYKVTDGNKELDSSILKVTIGEENSGNITVSYEFADSFTGKVHVRFTYQSKLGLVVEKECVIEKIENIEVSFDSTNALNYVQGTKEYLPYTITPEDADVSYSVSSNNDNVKVEMKLNLVQITAMKAGVSTITLEVTLNGDTTPIASTTIDVIVTPKSFGVAENALTFGDENLLTIGRTDILDKVVGYPVTLEFGTTTLGANFLENVSWKTNNPAVVVKDDKIYIEDPNFTGIVNVYGVFKYEDFSQETAPFKVRCIGNGINVYCYEDLLAASKENKPIILQADVVEDFGKFKDGTSMSIQDVYTEITSTYDITYYKNLNRLDLAKVKVLLSFKNDVYGNGKVINANNITNREDATGALLSDALFKGPLNFVAVTETGASAVSVKGQDNICFAVYEGVSLNNVQLVGRTLSADTNGSYDLTDLTYTGTVVEVLGDNVEVNYCRISNGRTVMRIFGDINDSSKVINVNINNSILSGAREFIIRMGSNHFVQGDKVDHSPYIDNNDKIDLPVYIEYTQKSEEQKKAFDDAYIKTFVNVKNCAFRDCGIFTFGLDSHFSGELLADGKNASQNIGSLTQLTELFEPWYDLAKTSYGAKLTFEGEVRIYDWKNVDSIDSSTLIDISLKGGSFDSVFKRLEFNVKELVTLLGSKVQFKDIIYTDNQGQKYVHGGIAFFGGGKNYCTFQDKSVEFESYSGYQVSFSDIETSYLAAAAGEEPFYFLLHNANSTFTPEKQNEMLSSGNPYDFVFKK